MWEDKRDQRILAWKMRRGRLPRAIEIASFVVWLALLFGAAIYAVFGLLGIANLS